MNPQEKQPTPKNYEQNKIILSIFGEIVESKKAVDVEMQKMNLTKERGIATKVLEPGTSIRYGGESILVEYKHVDGETYHINISCLKKE